jgi:phosphodiesterase/alkaline phosphatase D-like protein
MLVGLTSFAQNSIVIGPFLQDAEPNSITVIWETDAALESTVEWGLDEALGNTTSGSTSANNGMQLHEVTISGLDRFTKYYYKVITDGTESQVFQFKTPPFASDDESFRLMGTTRINLTKSFMMAS